MKYPIVTNAFGVPNMDQTQLVGILSEQITNAVLWDQSMTFLLGEGIDLFIEFGPSVLTAMFKRAYSDKWKFNAFAVGNSEQLRTLLKWLKDKGVEVKDI